LSVDTVVTCRGASTPIASKKITYTLNGSKPDDLKAHVGHSVQPAAVVAVVPVGAFFAAASAVAVSVNVSFGPPPHSR